MTMTTDKTSQKTSNARRVKPLQPQLPVGVYFAGQVELKGVSIPEPGIARGKLVSLIMPRFIPDELVEDKDKFERAGDENKPLRMYVFNAADVPPLDFIHELGAENHFMGEITPLKQNWKYEIAGGYTWQIQFDMAVPPLGEPDDIDAQAVAIADWLLNQPVCYVFLVDAKGA